LAFRPHHIRRMGKKRKIKEISDEERIQTILIRNPYGYQEPDTWDVSE